MNAQQYADSIRTQMRGLATRGTAMIEQAKSEGRDLTPGEKQRSNALMAEYESLKSKRDQFVAIAANDEAMDDAMRGMPVPTSAANRGPQPRDHVVSIGREARTYRQDNDPNGGQFVRDLIDDFYGRGRGESAERIDRHVAETRVENPHLMERSSSGVGTSAFTGLVVPQYLTDLVAPATANLRPYANNANRHVLPEKGMSVNISRITTPTSAALQANELDAVSFTDADDTLLTVNVLTAAGQQLVSRQAIERGNGVEDTLVSDLLRRVAVVVDSTMLNQATTGAIANAGTTTYTDASPTQTAMFPSFYKAQSSLESTLRGVANVNACFMTPARWNWYSSLLTTSFPLVSNGQMPVNASGLLNSNVYGDGRRGTLPNGVPVYVDANIPVNLGGGTNEDRILFVATDEVHLWEDANSPVIIRAEQPNVANLGVNLVAYEYFAYTHKRYANNPQMLAGTGQIVTTVLAGF